MSQVVRSSWWVWLWGAGYLVLLAAVVWWVFAAQRWALAELSTPRSIENWQEWRDDVRQQQDKPGPVRHRVPKSKEPPALVLMRDYFAVSLVGAIVFSSVLFWVIAWLVSGMISRGPQP